MSKVTKDGLTIYDLDPNASELWVVAGPAGYDVSTINADCLPEGFRWVDDSEWAELQNDRYRFENGKLYKLDGDAYVHCFSSIYADDEETAIRMYEESQS